MAENVNGKISGIYENGCFGEIFTKEELLNIISQAIETGEVKKVDWGAISVLKELNHGVALRFWIGTTAEYNALVKKENNVLYIKTDDTSAVKIKEDIETLRNDLAVTNDNIITLWEALSEHAVQKILALTTRVEKLESALNELKNRQDNLDNELNTKFAQLDVKFTNLSNQLTSIDLRVAALENLS